MIDSDSLCYSKDPINRIRKLAAQSTDELLDKCPVYENLWFDVLWMLVGENCETKLYADVPIWAIGAFAHCNMAHSGTSWKLLLHPSSDQLKSGVTGKGWTDEVFNYFTNPLMEESFPAEGSLYELRLHAYGNFVSVTNGIHRVVGAVNYLAATTGSGSAVLHQAKITYQKIDRELLEFLERERKLNSRIYISWVIYRERSAGIKLMSANCWGATVYSYINKKVNVTYKWIPAPDFLLRKFKEVKLLDEWFYVEPELLHIILRDDWLPTSNSSPQPE